MMVGPLTKLPKAMFLQGVRNDKFPSSLSGQSRNDFISCFLCSLKNFYQMVKKITQTPCLYGLKENLKKLRAKTM
jgi:hypothetical protein